MRGSKLVSAVAAVALVGILTLPTAAEAQSPRQKFNRGFSNLVLGWLEIPGSIKEEVAATNPPMGLLVGTVKGAFRTVRRTVTGGFELVTFPIAAPPGYEKMVEPEYPWQYFD